MNSHMGLGLKYVALIGMLMGSVVEAQVLNPLILPLNKSSHPFLVFDGRVPSNQVSMLANDLSRLPFRLALNLPWEPFSDHPSSMLKV